MAVGAIRHRRKEEETMNCMKASFLALGAVFLVTAQAGEDRSQSNFEIVSLSNRADLISGGDALLEVRVPKTVPLHQVRLLLNGGDVTATFRTDATGLVMRGVLTGLVQGQNDFIADSNGRGRGRPRASLTITNHPIGGPVLLGSQTQPWVCATPTPARSPWTFMRSGIGSTCGSRTTGRASTWRRPGKVSTPDAASAS